ncbi:MAG: hypothetical protein IPK26_10930 [Planctomycetes bacterium]|nr:hypothetical protein [Planctomycetota bacterium]
MHGFFMPKHRTWCAGFYGISHSYGAEVPVPTGGPDARMSVGTMAQDPVFSLHRYFLGANRMRTHFDDLLKQGRADVTEDPELRLYMEAWYGMLFVVVEGWRELALHDTEVDELLGSPHVDLLRRVRNGVFHFQQDYYDDRLLGFVITDGTAEWVRNLNRALGRFFLEHLRARRQVTEN